ncbi:MAG: hypothetical protein HC781_21705 [Leptolyngbyaceae cyanobacterium CSU_1_4]|nr:hypothetical protein [Leptolyngbyaceae cyanobacterium CSU_1_4]
MTHLNKDIENRSWRCYLEVGDLLAIHSGQKVDKEALRFIEQVSGQNLQGEEKAWETGIIAIATFGGNVSRSESPWFVGPYGWLLKDVVPIETIAAKGMQRLWTLLILKRLN